LVNPYIDHAVDGTIMRHFDENVDEWDLVWHRDESNRRVVVDKGTGWQIQFDNEMPIDILEGDEIYIKSMEYHRLIKGSSSLNLTIHEF
jgi:hypothetical protein